MSLATLLKTSREEQHLSQEDMATRLETSSQTISNWETGTVKPDNQKFPAIADAYGIDRKDFLREYDNDNWPVSKETIPDDFPTCLFTDTELEQISKLKFTPQEVEFLQIVFTYTTTKDKYSGHFSLTSLENFADTAENCDLFRHLPRKYVLRTGPAKLQQIARSIYDKTHDLRNRESHSFCCTPEQFLFEALLGQDCEAITDGFNVLQMPLESIVRIQEAFWPGTLRSTLSLVQDIKENGTSFLTVYDAEKESSDDDHKWPRLWTDEDSCSYYHKYVLHPENLDSESDWIQLHIHESKYKADPSSPAKTYIDTITATLTDKGEELYTFYVKHPDYFKDKDQ